MSTNTQQRKFDEDMKKRQDNFNEKYNENMKLLEAPIERVHRLNEEMKYAGLGSRLHFNLPEGYVPQEKRA